MRYAADAKLSKRSMGSFTEGSPNTQSPDDSPRAKALEASGSWQVMTSRPPGVRFTDVIDEEETAEPWSRPCAGYPPRSSSRAVMPREGPTPHTGAATRASCASSTPRGSPGPTTPATACSRPSATSRAMVAAGSCSSTSTPVERCSSPAGRRSTGTRSARAASPGAERVVDFEIDRVVEIGGRAELRYRLLGRSPFNPE